MEAQDIPGWGRFHELYERIVHFFPDPSTFVEIGCWMGQSTAYMASYIKNNKKAHKFYAVDTWKGEVNSDAQKNIVKEHGGSLFYQFVKNIHACRLLDYVIPLKMDSVDAAKLFPDAHFDFIFIDGCHLYEYVKADLDAWLPKLKKGGIIAGDDYQDPSAIGVVRAVQERFGDAHSVFSCDTWLSIPDADTKRRFYETSTDLFHKPSFRFRKQEEIK